MVYLTIGNPPALAKCKTPSLESPAADVKDAWDDGVCVHAMSDVEIAHFEGLGTVTWLVKCGLCSDGGIVQLLATVKSLCREDTFSTGQESEGSQRYGETLTSQVQGLTKVLED